MPACPSLYAKAERESDKQTDSRIRGGELAACRIAVLILLSPVVSFCLDRSPLLASLPNFYPMLPSHSLSSLVLWFMFLLWCLWVGISLKARGSMTCLYIACLPLLPPHTHLPSFLFSGSDEWTGKSDPVCAKTRNAAAATGCCTRVSRRARRRAPPLPAITLRRFCWRRACLACCTDADASRSLPLLYPGRAKPCCAYRLPAACRCAVPRCRGARAAPARSTLALCLPPLSHLPSTAYLLRLSLPHVSRTISRL